MVSLVPLSLHCSSLECYGKFFTSISLGHGSQVMRTRDCFFVKSRVSGTLYESQKRINQGGAINITLKEAGDYLPRAGRSLPNY